MGASLVCVDNLNRTADLVLWFPDKTAVCTHPWHQNDLIVFTGPLDLSKLATNYSYVFQWNSIHSYAFLYILMYSYEFLCISLYSFAFLCLPIYSYAFLCILMHTYALYAFLCILDSPISFLGCLYSCINNLKRTADLIFWFHDKTSVYKHPWQNRLIVVTVPLLLYRVSHD